MKIDIRKEKDNEITEIIFGETDSIRKMDPRTNQLAIGETGKPHDFYINNDEIDNLIKALQKAKELWVE